MIRRLQRKTAAERSEPLRGRRSPAQRWSYASAAAGQSRESRIYNRSETQRERNRERIGRGSGALEEHDETKSMFSRLYTGDVTISSLRY